MKEDWTAISDIGKYFDGQQLTNDSYKNIEDNYIKDIIESFSLEFFKNNMKKYPKLYRL